MSLLANHDALLLDLDGTVWEGGEAIPHAVPSINEAGVPTAYVTNNASKSPSLVAEQLEKIGLETTPEAVLTSAQAAILLAGKSHEPGTKVLVLGTPSFKDLAREYGYQVVESADDKPEVVLHGHNPETGWAQLSEAALAIAAGASYIASNLDSTLPMERGLFVGNGSMVAAVVNATGVEPVSAGKPEPAMFTLAAEKLGSKSPLAIGDRLNTDIAGGVAAGVDTLQVLTGVSGHRAVVAAPRSQRATYLATDMRALFDAPDLLRPAPQGGFLAERVGADIHLSGGAESSTAIQALRTVLAVAWDQEVAFEGEVVATSEHASRVLQEWR